MALPGALGTWDEFPEVVRALLTARRQRRPNGEVGMWKIAPIGILLIVTACHSNENAGKLTEAACAARGIPISNPAFWQCWDEVYPRYAQHSDGPSVNWAGLAAVGAQMMQGPPRPQVSTTNCFGYGNNVSCTKVTQ